MDRMLAISFGCEYCYCYQDHQVNWTYPNDSSISMESLGW